LLILENAGATAAVVTLQFIGKRGLVSAPSIGSVTVSPGRLAVVDISAAVGEKPISVVVSSSGGTIVVASASYTPGGGGFASSLGEIVPVPP
jgi:hypothetical protein